MDKILAALTEHVGNYFRIEDDKLVYENEGVTASFNIKDMMEDHGIEAVKSTITAFVESGDIQAASDLHKASVILEGDENNFFKKKSDDKSGDKSDDKSDDSKSDDSKSDDDKSGSDKSDGGEEKMKKGKKDDVKVDTKTNESVTENLSLKIKEQLIAEGLWEVKNEDEDVVQKRKSLIERLVAEEKYERGDRDFTAEFFAESFEDADKVTEIESKDVIYEGYELANGQKMIRIKYNADHAESIENWLQENSSSPIDANIVDPVTGKSLVSILGESFNAEEIKTVLAVFNSAVEDRVNVIREGLETRLNDKTAESVNAAVSAIDAVAAEVIAEWVSENKPAITDSVKMESMSALVKGVKSLFESYGLEVVEKESNVVSSLVSENVEFKNVKVDLETQLTEARAELAGFKTKQILESVTADLSMAQKERVNALMESVDTSDLAAFEEKAKVVVEALFVSTTKKTEVSPSADDVLSESVVKKSDTKVDPYAAFLRRTNRSF